MKCAAIVIFACLAINALSVQSLKTQSKIDSSSQKVVDLLKKVKDEVTREGEVEDVQFTRYADFCHKTTSDKEYAIKRSTETIIKLEALIESMHSASEALDADVKKAQETIAAIDADIQEATDTRAKEKEAYDAEAKDMNAAIAAMYKAIVELENAKGNLKGNVKALPQLSSVASQVLDTMERVNLIKLSEDQAKMLGQMAKPKVGEAADYHYKSGDIVQMLKDLRMTFKENRQQLDMAEMEAKNAFDLKVQGLKNERQLKAQEESEKSLESAKKKERKGSAETEKVDEENVKAADEAFLADLTADCEAKAAQHKQRSGVRTGELEALAKAIDFLKKGTDASFLSKPHSFLQLSKASSVQTRGLRLLTDAARKHKDASISVLALTVRASNPDQGGTVDLIKDLINQLKEQDEAATKRKNDCDQEIEEVSANSGSLIRKHETLVSTDEQKTAERNEKLQQAATLGKEIAQLKKTLEEATNLRNKERAENEISLAKAKEASEACKFAIETLSQFYDSVALIQVSSKTKKETPASVAEVAPKFTIEEGDYKGREGGIVGEVQKLKDEMDTSVSETEEYESTAESDFKTLSEETEASVEAKTTEMTDAKTDSDNLQAEIMKIKDETADTSEAAALAQKELDHVKAKCDDGATSFEEQKKNRAQEIKDLESVIDAIA
eukprot:TRINITY_DN145_c0_g1_i1.p1 TRINITY_DN145_c0_g1~~TRINITY_DN145_c0_g1_i1.p1  ORF type:complete len:672 (-),score=238.90 TRINITY_DN145_c0_g1_i1:58-2073(-)